ncbi:hypothetical protein [Haliangium sp.]|uniref:hypothetical protein n=1 Tax=Haliangium sp. TaxID=2663208 RepID=UPI003D0B4E4F
MLAALGLVLAASAWFFASEDNRGPTARLAADAPYYHSYLPSLLFDHDLDFTNEYRITNNWYRFGKTPLGRPSNVFGIGPALFALPGFGVGHLIALAAGDEANGFSAAEVKATMFASLLFSLGALWFTSRLLRRRLGGHWRPALVPLLLAVAGPVVYYAVRQPGYAHPFATFWAAWLLDHWDASFDGRDQPRSWRCWLGMGALVGVAALARPQLALWALVLGPMAAIDDVARARRAGLDLGRAVAVLAARAVAAAALSVAVFSPQLLAWKAIYGAYYAVPQGEGFMRWDAPAWSEVLMSSRNGLLPWAPLYALAAVGLVAGLRRHPRLFGAALVGVAAQTVTNGAAWDWWAGGSFGGRRFDSCFAAFALGLGLVLIPTHPARLSRPDGWAAGVAAWRTWLAPTARAIGFALALILAAGNLSLAGRLSSPTVRIYGGARAADSLGRTLPAPLSAVCKAASSLANLPARALFAWRYDTPLDTYDRVVGVHVLGELYPGLNSFRGKRRQSISLDPGRPDVFGLNRAGKEDTVAPSGHARVLVGLNRLGPVHFDVNASVPTGTEAVRLRFQGHEIGRAQVSARTRVSGRAETSARGVNVLEILGPPGLVVHSLEVRAPTDALGR